MSQGRDRFVVLWLIGGLCCGAIGAAQDAPYQALVSQYCVACHNSTVKTADLALDTVLSDDVSLHAETWEKVVRRLKVRQMPPIGIPRPNEAEYQAAADSLTSRLDREAAQHPNPGRTDTFPPAEPHRVRQRDPRSAGSRDRCGGAAAGGRVEPWVRQHHRRRSLAHAARPLCLGGGEDQSVGDRHPGTGAGRGHHPRAAGPDPGEAHRGPADRHARRRAGPVHVPGGRRVRDTGSAWRATATSRSKACEGSTRSRSCSTASASRHLRDRAARLRRRARQSRPTSTPAHLRSRPDRTRSA